MNALANHRQHLVPNLPALAPVTEPTRHCRGQAHLAVDFAQQQSSAIGGNGTPGEIHPNLAFAAV